MNLDEARAQLFARQEAEATELAKAHARELELAMIQMTDRHRREFIELGRRQIAERDLIATATLAAGQGDHQGDRGPVGSN